MFKDVVSKGWMRLHILLGTVGVFLVVWIFLVAVKEVDRIKALKVVLPTFIATYWVLFLFIIWVKRGFKKP
ncbi:MAG: hypothetical protein P8L23_06395 [Flavobacteriales bacterium]|nr:hypothetical protein [Flavobacteriales bacterium]